MSTVALLNKICDNLIMGKLKGAVSLSIIRSLIKSIIEYQLFGHLFINYYPIYVLSILSFNILPKRPNIIQIYIPVNSKLFGETSIFDLFQIVFSFSSSSSSNWLIIINIWNDDKNNNYIYKKEKKRKEEEV